MAKSRECGLSSYIDCILAVPFTITLRDKQTLSHETVVGTKYNNLCCMLKQIKIRTVSNE